MRHCESISRLLLPKFPGDQSEKRVRPPSLIAVPMEPPGAVHQSRVHSLPTCEVFAPSAASMFHHTWRHKFLVAVFRFRMRQCFNRLTAYLLSIVLSVCVVFFSECRANMSAPRPRLHRHPLGFSARLRLRPRQGPKGSEGPASVSPAQPGASSC